MYFTSCILNNFSRLFLFSVTICIINSYDTRWASGVQIFFTAAKLLAIVVIIIGGFVRLGQGKKNNQRLQVAVETVKTKFRRISSHIIYPELLSNWWTNRTSNIKREKNAVDLEIYSLFDIPLKYIAF